MALPPGLPAACAGPPGTLPTREGCALRRPTAARAGPERFTWEANRGGGRDGIASLVRAVSLRLRGQGDKRGREQVRHTHFAGSPHPVSLRDIAEQRQFRPMLVRAIALPLNFGDRPAGTKDHEGSPVDRDAHRALPFP
jgi:hypothetical protein